MSLEDKIEARETQVCIIGLGYVGFAKAGYRVFGLDVDSRKVSPLVTAGMLIPTTDYHTLSSSNWRLRSIRL